MSGAGGLESALHEVEPILRGNGAFQFTHPSFREVLAARQCADEINSGRLNISDVYGKLWNDLNKGKEVLPAFTAFSLRLVNMVSEDKSREFVDSVGGKYAESIMKLRASALKVSDYPFMADLVLCATYIGKFKNSDFPDGQAKKILDALMLIAVHGHRGRRYFHGGYYLPGDFAKNALALTKSSYVAQKLIDYIRYYEEGTRYYWDGLFSGTLSKKTHYLDSTVIELVSSGFDVEGYLLKLLPNRTAVHFDYCFELLGRVGAQKSLEALIHEMPRESTFTSTLLNSNNSYFAAIFEILRRCDFNPEQVKMFNEKISGMKNGRFLHTYHNTLEYFAKSILKYGKINLYDHLETKGVQFFDSWVYKPK